ncbi:DUF3800 domain-containing protein [candidate division GN15 bacterium]|nr:DUF3800 domain-containing protein [candidate division GN15 bacterium]
MLAVGRRALRIAYYDETGDDGFPLYSSDFFVLTAVHMHYLDWHSNFERLRSFRRLLRNQLSLPLKWEFHTKYFLLNKNPYRQLVIADPDRIATISALCSAVSQMRFRVVTVCIDKKKIIRRDYRVLDTALRYSIQRIENDIKPAVNPEGKFLIITDEGRQGAMTKTSRAMQKINYIPSKFSGRPMRQEIVSLIEDPLPKNSKESYFIQVADLISYVTYLYAAFSRRQVESIGARVRQLVSDDLVMKWMKTLQPVLAVEATEYDQFGVVFHPRR